MPTYRLDFAYPAGGRRGYDGEAHEGREAEGRGASRVAAQARMDGHRRPRVGDFTGDALDRWLDELRSALAPAYSNRRW